MSNIVKARITIKGVRPLLQHHFGPDALPPFYSGENMSGLIRRKPTSTTSKFIKLREAAQMLDLDESTVRKGRAGTKDLHLIRQGDGPRARIFLLRAEVEEHCNQLIANAQRLKELPEQLVWNEREAHRNASINYRT